MEPASWRDRRFWIQHAAPALAVLGFLVVQGAYLASHSLDNWDALPYTALGLSAFSDAPDDAIQRDTYASAARAVSPSDWRNLTEGNPYVAETAHHPAKFAHQFAFYRDRVLYIGSIALLAQLGVEPFRAPFLISVACYGLLCLLIFAWLRKVTSGWTGLAVTVLIANLPFVLVPARLGTPDAMCTLFTVAATCALVARQRVGLFAIFGICAIAARSDAILFVLAMLAGVALLARPAERPSRKHCLLAALAALAFFFGLEAWSQRAAWWDVVVFTLVQGTPDWVAGQPFEWKTYLGLLARHWPLAEGYYGWVVYLMGLVAVRGAGFRWQRMSLARAALSAAMLAGLARYLALPRFFDWDRHYASAYAPTLILAVVLLVGERTPARPGPLGDPAAEC